jgi:hypothetical protein
MMGRQTEVPAERPAMRYSADCRGGAMTGVEP